MKVARLVYYSPNLDSYADSIAAIMDQGCPEKIEIAFPDGRYMAKVLNRGKDQSDFIKRIHDQLSEVGKSVSQYQAAGTVQIIPTALGDNPMDSLLAGTDLLDITTVPKKLAAQVVAAALKRGSPRVSALTWLVPIPKDSRLRIGRDPYEYVDLTQLQETAELRRSYAARASLLLCMGVGILGVAVLAALSRWFPVLAAANGVLVAISVAAGFAGLYVATKGS